jgi:hypothetical protein
MAETLFTVTPLVGMLHRTSMWLGTPVVLHPEEQQPVAHPTVAMPRLVQPRVVRPRLVAQPAETPLAAAIVVATAEMAPAVSGLAARALAATAEPPTAAALLLVAVALEGPAARLEPVFLAMPLLVTVEMRIQMQSDAGVVTLKRPQLVETVVLRPVARPILATEERVVPVERAETPLRVRPQPLAGPGLVATAPVGPALAETVAMRSDRPSAVSPRVVMPLVVTEQVETPPRAMPKAAALLSAAMQLLVQQPRLSDHVSRKVPLSMAVMPILVLPRVATSSRS